MRGRPPTHVGRKEDLDTIADIFRDQSLTREVMMRRWPTSVGLCACSCRPRGSWTSLTGCEDCGLQSLHHSRRHRQGLVWRRSRFVGLLADVASLPPIMPATFSSLASGCNDFLILVRFLKAIFSTRDQNRNRAQCCKKHMPHLGCVTDETYRSVTS